MINNIALKEEKKKTEIATRLQLVRSNEPMRNVWRQGGWPNDDLHFFSQLFHFSYQRKNQKMMIEVICNDRLGKKVRVKCNHDDTIGDLKKLIAAQTGTKAEKIVLKKWCK